MKTFKDYYSLTERTYSYRIKTIVPLDDVRTTAIEAAIVKYDPFDISVSKTILQANPLDFGNVPPSEVYIIDVTLGLPASQLSLRQEICRALHAPDKFVVVRGANDPIENEVQRIEAETAIADEARKAGLTPDALLNDPSYKEAEEFVATDMYGDKYNTRFVAYLKKVSDARKAENAARAAAVMGPANPLFDFLAPVGEPGENFNAANEPSAKESSAENPMNDRRSIQGNYDTDGKQYRRVFKTKDGKEKLLTKDGSPVRKGK